MITDQQLAEWQALCDAAEPYGYGPGETRVVTQEHRRLLYAARTALPALLEEVRKQREEIDRWKAEAMAARAFLDVYDYSTGAHVSVINGLAEGDEAEAYAAARAANDGREG